MAARKIRGGRVRGMQVLVHMNTARLGSTSTAAIEETIQCPCECGMQNIEHVMSDCEYMLDYLFEMVDTIDCRLS